MREKDEMEFHRKMKNYEGQHEINTNWGKIRLQLEAIPNYAGGKGRPDELLVLSLKFSILGTDVQQSIPVLIELEENGFNDAFIDLDEFCRRSISGEQKSYIDIPMIVVGGQNCKKLAPQEKQLSARFNLTQVPKRVIP